MSKPLHTVTAHDLWTVSQTVWGESRGEGLSGQRAVAWVVRNRKERHARWRTKTLAMICRAPAQFSCWTESDPNYPKLLRVGLGDTAFVQCLHVALEVLSGEVDDITHGATHYYNPVIPAPFWAVGETPVAEIGHHRFYSGIA